MQSKCKAAPFGGVARGKLTNPSYFTVGPVDNLHGTAVSNGSTYDPTVIAAGYAYFIVECEINNPDSGNDVIANTIPLGVLKYSKEMYFSKTNHMMVDLNDRLV